MVQTAPSRPDSEYPDAPLEAERAPSVVLAGNPFFARQLRRQLPADWRVTLIYPVAGEGAFGDEFEVFSGDPTSALVLQRAGAAEARAVLAALPDVVENHEVCRIARQQLQIPHVIAVVPTEADANPFRELGVEVIVESAILAAAARNLLNRGTLVLEQAGAGHGELVQITLQSSSPVIGRRVRNLRQQGWSIAAVYRGERIIIPEATTTLQSDDRLLLVGEPERLAVIAEYLRAGHAQFPLPYGRTIAAIVWGAPDTRFLEEVAYVVTSTATRRLILRVSGADRGWQEAVAPLALPVEVVVAHTAAGPAGAVAEALQTDSPGCLILRHERARLPHPFSGVAAPLAHALAEAAVPVLIPRGSFPYEQVLLPVARAPMPQGAVQAAFDLSEQLGAELVTVHVRAPSMLAETSDAAGVIDAALSELSALRRRQLRHERPTGNPLAEVKRLATANQLVVLSHSRRARRLRTLRPDVSAYLSQRLPSSVLVLPVDAR